MRKRRPRGWTALGVLVVCVAMIVMAGCQGTAQKETVVKIGVNGPQSGQYSKIGLDALNAVKLAVDEFNESKQVPGLRIEVVPADDAADPAKGTAAIEKLCADPQVVGIIGFMMSHIAEACNPIAERAGVAVISQSATNPVLTERGFKVFHRVCPRDDAMGPASAIFMVEKLGAKKVYIIDDKTTYGQGVADQIEAKLKSLGIQELKRDQISVDDKDFSAILSRVKKFDPDVLYLAITAPAQAANIAKQKAALGIRAQLMGGEVLYERDEFVLGSGGKAEGAYLTSIGPVIEDVPEAQDFIKKYGAKYGARSAYTGQSYEAAKIFIEAIKKAYENDKKVDRAEVLQNVKKTEYKGVLGIPIAFDERGDLRGGTVFILQVKDDNYRTVQTVSVTR